MKIKKGDKVIVIAGHEKGKEGVVIKTYPKEELVVVEGLNKVTKHNKPNQQNSQGSITTKEAPIHVSNVAILDPKKKVATKVGYREEVVDGKKVKYRYAKKSGTRLDK